MIAQFEMINIGLISYFNSTEATHIKDDIFISYNKYASDVLKKSKWNPVIQF